MGLKKRDAVVAVRWNRFSSTFGSFLSREKNTHSL
jgi:hypothetical protein